MPLFDLSGTQVRKKNRYRYCPCCDSSLTGEKISPEHQEAFGYATHFGRACCVEDYWECRVIEWTCPDCGGRWERYDDENEMANKQPVDVGW